AIDGGADDVTARRVVRRARWRNGGERRNYGGGFRQEFARCTPGGAMARPCQPQHGAGTADSEERANTDRGGGRRIVAAASAICRGVAGSASHAPAQIVH